MIVGYTTSTDAYRARTNAMRTYARTKPKCACGKEFTSAVQKKRYGKCVACMREQAK